MQKKTLLQKNLRQKQNVGFALLLTLIIVSVVLSIGLAMIDSTLQQLVLSGTARDSEIAFHAAYAGIECGEYWARKDQVNFLVSGPNAPGLKCMGKNAAGTLSHPDSNIYKASYGITWGGANEKRCTQFDLYFLDAATANTDVIYTFPTYVSGNAKTCQKGAVCTYVSSRGYNRDCGDTNSIQAVQRELFLQF